MRILDIRADYREAADRHTVDLPPSLHRLVAGVNLRDGKTLAGIALRALGTLHTLQATWAGLALYTLRTALAFRTLRACGATRPLRTCRAGVTLLALRSDFTSRSASG